MAGDPTISPDTLDAQTAAAAQQQQTTAQTLQEKADASAAWLAQNRPDLVSRPSASAEEAARINLAYRQNTLPVLPKYGAPAPGSPGTEQDLTRVYIGGTSEVQGTPMDLTRSQYITMFGRTPEASEAAKYQQFNAPIDYGAMSNLTLGQIASRYGDITAGRVQDYYAAHPSARALAITQMYEQQHATTISSGGSYIQQSSVSPKNPFPENTAAGIAWTVGRQQGGQITESMAQTAVAEYKAFGYTVPADYSSRLTGTKTVAGAAVVSGMETVPVRDLSYEATQYGGGGNVGSVYQRMAWAAVQERPGYTAPKDLGDITTQRVVAGYTAFSQVMGMTGERVASPTTMTGQVLETQRQMAYMTPSRRDETFFMGELQKWGENYVEIASAYHHYTLDVGAKTGVAAPANPFEYQADLAVEFLKGAPQRDVERFSPVSGEMSRHLPGGEGIQQFAWREAVSTYRRMEGEPYSTPKQVSFMEGVRYLGAAEGLYGPYGKLYGGIDTGGVRTVSADRLAGGGMVAGTAATEPGPVSSTSVMRPSDIALFAMQANIPVLSGAVVATSDFLFSGTGPIAMVAKSGADVFKSVGVGPGGEQLFGRQMITTEVWPTIRGKETVSIGEPSYEYTALPGGGYQITTTVPVTKTGSEVTPVTVKYTPVEGGFEAGARVFAEQVTMKNLPVMSEEFGKGTPWEYNIAMARGAYMGIREHPLEAATWFGIGGVMVAGGAAVASLGEATIAATAGTGLAPVAVGTHWFASTAAPVALTTLYGVDVMQRSTQAHLYTETPGTPFGLKLQADLSPKSTERFGEIFATEAGPMIAGGMFAMYAPGAIRGGVARTKAAWEGWEPRSPRQVYNQVYESVATRIDAMRSGSRVGEVVGGGGLEFTYRDVTVTEPGYTVGGKTVGGPATAEVPMLEKAGPGGIPIEDFFGPVPEGYTRIGHVTTATEEILAGVSERGLMVGRDTVSLAQTSVDLTGQAPWPYSEMSAPSASTATWFKAMQETYLEGKAGRNMFGDYSRFGGDILIFDVPTSMYGEIAGSKPFYTGEGTFKGVVTREQLARGYIDVEKPASVGGTGGITPEEYSYIIREYTGPNFEEISGRMRSGEGLVIGGKQYDVGTLFEQHGVSLQDVTYAEGGVLYRGITGRTAGSLFGKTVGDIYSDASLQSFTSSRSQAFMFTESGRTIGMPRNAPVDVVLKYAAGAEERVIVPGEKSFMRDELEIILHPGEFKIADIATETIGSHEVRMITLERTYGGRAAGRSDMGIDFAAPPSTALVPVGFQRTVVNTAYDITSRVATYDPLTGRVDVLSIRDIITSEKYGGVKSIQTTERAVIDVEQYALGTGRVYVPEVGATIETADVFRIQTVKEVYPSGRTYEFTIGMKGSTTEPGTAIGGLVSSRGVAFGEAGIARGKMGIADEILEAAVARGSQKTPPVSPTDLVRSITDVSTTVGRVSQENLMTGVDITAGTTRVVRAEAPLEEVFAKMGEDIFGTQGGEGPAPREVLIQRAMGQPGAAFSLFKNLPDYGVVGKEIIGGVEGARPAPYVEGKTTFEVTKEITDAVFGRDRLAIESEATKLRGKAGVERILATGQKVIGRTLPQFEQKPTKGAKGKAAGGAVAGGPQQGIQIQKPTATKEASDIAKQMGKVIEGVLSAASEKEASLSKTGAGGVAKVREETGISKGLPERGIRSIEEEFEFFPSKEAMEKTGLAGRASGKDVFSGISDLLGTRPVIGIASETPSDILERRDIIGIVSSRQNEVSVRSFDIGRESVTDVMKDVLRKFGSESIERVGQRDITDQRVKQDILQFQDVLQDQKTIQDQITKPYEETKPFKDTWEYKWEIPPPPVLPTGGLGYGGGAGGWPVGMLGRGKRKYRNPVVDIEYLVGLAEKSSRKGRNILDEFKKRR